MSISYAPETLNCIPRAAQATVETMRTRKAIPVHQSASTDPGPYSRFLCKKLWKVQVTFLLVKPILHFISKFSTHTEGKPAAPKSTRQCWYLSFLRVQCFPSSRDIFDLWEPAEQGWLPANEGLKPHDADPGFRV